MTRRHAFLAWLVVSLAAFAGFVAPAQSGDPAATELLPNLRQEVPSDVRMSLINGSWRLGFASDVANDGPGYLKITGNGPGDAPMVADQIVQMSDGTSTTVPGIGEMHYVIGGGHEHWHLLDFERYELRAAGDPATPIVTDQKTGYCLADAFTADRCGQNQPDLTTVSEGIAAGGSDKYLGYLEGQYLTIDPTTAPDGDYLLVNRSNPTGALQESDESNNASSVRLNLSWGNDGNPVVRVTNKCAGAIDCPPPPDPLPDPAPDPQPQPITAPEPGPTPSQPETVPLVPTSLFTPRDANALLSRSMAGRLVRRAIVRSLGFQPRRLRTGCGRRDRATFACSSHWRGPRLELWRANVRVWYVLTDGRLSWFYSLDARRSSGGEHVVRRSIRGSSSQAFRAGPAGSLYCVR